MPISSALKKIRVLKYAVGIGRRFRAWGPLTRAVYAGQRILFWVTSGGRDLDRIDPTHLTFRKSSGRAAVATKLFSESATLAVILGVGQSNIGNEGDPKALFAPKGQVYNFNFFNGRCYRAKDPLLGAGMNRSNALTRVGDLLTERGYYQRVLLVPIAHGGTFASEWAPGGRMFPRVQLTFDRLKERNIKLTHIMWQQGEAEAAQEKADPEQWKWYFNSFVSAIRAKGSYAPIYVAQCTVCCNDPNEQIRSAQREVVSRGAGILPGPDLDTIGREERWDGCHFSAIGLRHAADLWCSALCGLGVERELAFSLQANHAT
jgi:hypothetical protein